MAIKYLYIDDENIASLEPLIDAILERSDELQIVIKHPKEFEDNLDVLPEILANYDGIILDWRLDEIKGSDGRAKFRAGALAQEIRTRATENQIKDLPIVLWSTNEKLQGSFKGDDTSHDLFDEIYLKEDIVRELFHVHRQLVSLGEGYIDLRKLPNTNILQMALGLTIGQSSSLDVNIFSALSRHDGGQFPIHKIARFVLSEIINRPGLLIDENYLAAKLGIDIEQSAGWQQLRDEYLKDARYRGVFHAAWERWWVFEVREWWSRLGDIKPMSRYSASERVNILQDKLKLSSLQVAAPIMSHYSTRYDTICQHYKRPLDKLDGVIVHEQEPKSWQDHRYLSLKAVLSREYKDTDKWKPHPIELERLEELRKSRKQ